MSRSLAPLAAVGAIAVLGASVLIAQPRTVPPVESTIVNMISDFADSHPDWAVLREQRADAATVALNHARHMNPDTVGMQDDLSAGGHGIPGVEHLADGRLALTCASCHRQDAAGRYMEPISFDRHCLSCHEGDLPRVGDQRVPHGDMSALVDQVNLYLLRQQLDALNKSGGRVGSMPGSVAFVAMLGAGMLGEGSTDLLALRPPPPPSSGNDAAPATPTGQDIDAILAEARHSEFAKLKTNCMKCHTKDSITPAPRRPKGEPFDVAPPMIPTRWLDRSVFSHQSHRALNCLECHAQAAVGEKTSDIMLPSIDSCRSCHAPAAGVRSDCVMCHLYHPPLEPQPSGSITIKEYAGAGSRQK